MTTLKTSGINFLATTQEGAQQLLLVGIKEAYRNKPQYVKALQREYTQGHDLDHPHLLHIVDMKDVEGYGPCLRLEWEDSRTIMEYLQEQHSEEEKKAIVMQVAEAISYLHDEGRVHGALSPSVIFVTRRDNQVRVLNIRQRYADNLTMPALELRFIAPEAKDGTVTLDARADIYSLGQLLKLMDISDDYQTVIAHCCSFGRNERYSDVDSFCAAIDHRRITHTRRAADDDELAPSEGSRRGTSTALAVAVIAALLIVVVLWFINKNSSSSSPAGPAQTEVADTTHPEGTIANGEASAPTDATQPDAQSAEQPTTQYTGDNAFLTDLVPQMHKDLDKIYAAANGNPALARRKVATYYKGLRNVLRKRGLNQQQLAAFDEEFASYNKSLSPR